MSKVQVKPIQGKKWHEKKGNESFTKTKVICALVDANTMTYATGLNYTDRNYTDPSDPKVKITEAEYYGKLLKADLSNQFNLDEPHPFWDSKISKVRLENRTMIFETNIPLNYVLVKFMKQSKYIANSMKEYEEGLWPEATHVIFDESEEVEVKATKVAIKKDAIIQSAKLSKGQKIELILVLSSDNGDYIKAKNLKGKSDDFVEVELDKLIESKPAEVLSHIKMDKEDLASKALVLEALQKHVFTKEGHKIKYHESVLGQDIQDVVLYLNKPENQEFKLRIISQVN